MSQLLLQQAVMACADVAHRAGATEFEFSYSGGEPVIWTARATINGKPVYCRHRTPMIAVDMLACKLLDGAVCKRCNHVISVGGRDQHFCIWRRRGDKWVASCGLPIDKDVAMLPRVT